MGGALQAPLSGWAEGRVPMAVSAPLPLWWVGSGSPADAEQSRVNPRGRRAKESSLKGLGVACPNPPGSRVQPSPPGEKAPPWGGPDQGASGRGPSGGGGDAARWGGALGQAARHVSAQVCEAAVPSPPWGLGAASVVPASVPSRPVNHSENSSLGPPRPRAQGLRYGARGQAPEPGSHPCALAQPPSFPQLCAPPRHQVEGPHRPRAEREPWRCSGLLAPGGRVSARSLP